MNKYIPDGDGITNDDKRPVPDKRPKPPTSIGAGAGDIATAWPNPGRSPADPTEP